MRDLQTLAPENIVPLRNNDQFGYTVLKTGGGFRTALTRSLQ
jgi:hypothetical protein